MRSLTIPLVLIAVLGLGGVCSASDVNLPKHTPDELKAICAKAGGKFSQDSGGYGCGTDCRGGAGTDCTVFCKPDQKCVAQVIGSRRPRHAFDALQPPVKHAR